MKSKYINKVSGGIFGCLLFLASWSLTACDDYLDVTPSDKQTASQVFANKAGFYTAANGIYDALSSDNLYGAHMTWEALDLMSRCYATGNSLQVYKSLAENSYTDTYAAPILSEIWGKAYSTILAANLLIDQVDNQQDKLTTLEANCLKGEMLAVRAFLHLDMLRLFGPTPANGLNQLAIPYNESSNVTTLDLITIEEAGQKIIRDLEQAEELLKNDPIIENGPMMSAPENGESVQLRYRQYRMNYYAVLALKARAYLWVNDYEHALATAMNLINDSKANEWFPVVDPNKLLANTSNPDRVFSSEVFFGVYDKYRDQVFDNYFSSSAPNYQRFQPYAAYLTGRSGLFTNLLLGTETTDYRFQSQWEQASGVGATGHTFIKYKAIDKPDPYDQESEYYYAKMIPLISMQEMYYIASESATTATEKVEWYNKARIRRGLPDLNASVYGAYFPMYWVDYDYGNVFLSNEVRREFWGTGQWFFFAKHVSIYGGPGSFYPNDCGAEQTSGTLNIQPPLPVAEMK